MPRLTPTNGYVSWPSNTPSETGDSFLNSNGQNMYAYKPEHGRWTLMIWDYNIVLGLGGYSDGPSGDDLFKPPAATTE